MKTVYACSGDCHQWVTEEEYKDGRTHCVVQECTRYKRPYEEKFYCEECRKVFDKGKMHICEARKDIGVIYK